mgnify:CR=1 FL=1
MEFIVWDIIFLLVMALCVISNAKKGFSNVIVSFAAYMISVALAFGITETTSGGIYNSYVKDPVTRSLTDTLRNFSVSDELKNYYYKKTVGFDMSDKQVSEILNAGDNMDSELSELINSTLGENICDKNEAYDGLYGILNKSFQEKISEKLPPCAGKYFSSLADKNKDSMFELIDIIATEDQEAAAKYIEENYIHNLIIKFIKVIMFIFLSVIFITLSQVILRIIRKKASSTALGTADSVAGGVVGAFVGLTVMVVTAFVIKMIIYAGLTGSFINEEAINNSIIFKYLYRLDTILVR